MRYEQILSMIKPSWLDWSWLFGLLTQVALATLVLYGAFCMQSESYVLPPGRRGFSDLEVMLGASLALLAIVAAVAIYRNRWWGYFLEILLTFSLLFAYKSLDLPEIEENSSAYKLSIPYINELTKLLSIVSLILFIWTLIKKTVTLYIEQSTSRRLEQL